MVQNPTKVLFVCPDHDLDIGHEIDTVDDQGVVVGTLEVGKGTFDPATGIVTIDVSLLPSAAGKFTTRVRATAGDDVESPTSADSEVWHRAPRAPTNVRVA